MSKRKKAIPLTLKINIWDHYVGLDIGRTKCLCCDKRDILQASFSAGHIVSEHDGGKTTIRNLVPICQSCNSSCGTENLLDFMKRCGTKKESINSIILLREKLPDDETDSEESENSNSDQEDKESESEFSEEDEESESDSDTDIEEKSMSELKKLAKNKGLKKYNSLGKTDLIRLLEKKKKSSQDLESPKKSLLQTIRDQNPQKKSPEKSLLQTIRDEKPRKKSSQQPTQDPESPKKSLLQTIRDQKPQKKSSQDSESPKKSLSQTTIDKKEEKTTLSQILRDKARNFKSKSQTTFVDPKILPDKNNLSPTITQFSKFSLEEKSE